MIEELYVQFKQCSGVCTDTRQITPDCMFFALTGDNFNGNEFALKAIQNGAKYAVVDQPIEGSPQIIQVDNALETLQKLARYHRDQFNIPVFALTGTNGKTSTKELINACLSQKYTILATKGNLNNHIGVPLTILQLNETHDIAVIEMGANKLGDIDELCQIGNPDVGMITNVGKAHLEGFGSFEGVKRTKGEMYRFIHAKGGDIIINADDEDLLKIGEGMNHFYYGSKNVVGRYLGSNPYIKLEWCFESYESGELKTNMFGAYNYMNMMAAVAVASYYNVPPEMINQGLCSYTPNNNRSQIVEGRNRLILDAYNANPTSMKTAISTFYEVEGDKLCILGDMLELGEYTEDEHNAIIELLENLNLDAFLVGPIFKTSTSKFKTFSSNEELKAYLQAHPVNDHNILIKGSRGIQLEVLEEILA